MLTRVHSSFVLGTPVQGNLFVDREAQLSQASKIFSTTNGNVLLTGARRVGKTSLCLKLLEIASRNPRTISTYMSMEVNYGQSPAKFTQGVLLHLIKVAGSKVYGKSYSQLLHDLGRPKTSTGDYRTLLRVFELARQESIRLGNTTEKSVGAELVAKTTLAEARETQVGVSSLAAFEYLELLDEVLELLRSRSIVRSILFIDEANKLALETNSSIIRDNLTLFSSKGLQFCFVTTAEVVQATPEIRELFRHRIELSAFDSSSAVEDLIERYCEVDNQSISARSIYDSEAIEAIWRLSQGLPHRIQRLCRASLKYAIGRSHQLVSVSDVLDSVNESGDF